MHNLHIAAAVKNGITPLEARADTINQMDMLVRLPHELPLYRQYQITHSIPYLVPTAAKLFVDIAQNFRDSLYSKKMPIYKLYLTSITRTNDDTKKLTKRNINAVATQPIDMELLSIFRGKDSISWIYTTLKIFLR